MENVSVKLCLVAAVNVIGIKTWSAEVVGSITAFLMNRSRKKSQLHRLKKNNQYCSRTNSVVVEAISFGAASHILSSSVRKDMVSST